MANWVRNGTVPPQLAGAERTFDICISGHEHRPLHRGMPLAFLHNAKIPKTSRCLHCDVGCLGGRDSPLRSRDDLYG